MENEWISVKDRLPDHEGQYLVFWRSKFHIIIKTARLNRGANNKNPRFYGNASCQVKYITHWMILPNPPEE